MFSVILAHTNPPKIIQVLRSFDVPLMVIASGALFGISRQTNDCSLAGNYLLKRISRLVAPTWTFLLIFFSLSYLLFLVTGRQFPFSAQHIIRSILLLNEGGIGYLWIVRVFFLMAIITPFLQQIDYKIRSNVLFLAIVGIGYISYDLIYFVMVNMRHVPVGREVGDFVFYVFAYGFLFLFGIRLPYFTKKTLTVVSIVSFLVFLTIAIFNHYSGLPLYTEHYKYPPRLYFMVYGVFITTLIFQASSYLSLTNPTLKKITIFISTSTMWVYLWHIWLLYLWSWTSRYIPNNYLIAFFSFVFISVCITYIQKWIVNIFIVNKRHNDGVRVVLSAMFLK